MKKLWIAVVLAGSLGVSYAQEAADTFRLTYREAVKIALENNLTLNQQKNNLVVRQVQKNQSIAAFLPSLSISGSARHTEGQQPNPDGGELMDLSVDNVDANIQAGLMLFNGFNRINTLGQYSNQFKAQTSFVKRTEQDVVYTVTTQYLQVLLDQELLRIATEAHRVQNVILNQLREQVNLGARAAADMYTQDAQVRNLEVTALQARVTLENDKALLAQTLQLDPGIPVVLEFPSIENSMDIRSMSLDSLYAVALANREDLKQAEYQAKANHYAYKASVSGYFPSISLFAGYGSQYISTLRDQPLYGDFGNQFKTVFPSVSYGVNVTIPIFDRLATRSQRVFNKITYENSVLQRENIQKAIKIDVKQMYNNYITASESYQASQVQLQAGELALRTQQEGFILGAASQVELAQANQIYVQAAASRAQAEVTLLFQQMLMEYALGTLRVDTF
ncbi:MAG TPA: TolC family protein [Chryseosolibacter sp.]|nr:TolC family protein [Chryseosolibacter sp.]